MKLSLSNETSCTECGDVLNASNRYRAYSGYYYNQCIKCKRKRAHEYARKRAKAKEEGKFF